MQTPHTIPYNAEGSIAAYTIVKGTATAAPLGVVAAAANTDQLLGVTTDVAAVANENCDVIVQGPAFVKAGGTLAIGDLLTADASGNAIKAASLTGGTNYRIIGTALEIAASGDVIRMMVGAASIQG